MVARLPVMIICPRPATRFYSERWPRYFVAYHRALLADALRPLRDSPPSADPAAVVSPEQAPSSVARRGHTRLRRDSR